MNSKPIEVIPFAVEKWNDIELTEPFTSLAFKVFENENGLLNLSFEVDGESVMYIMDACPCHFRDQIEYFWIGLMQGYELAYDLL